MLDYPEAEPATGFEHEAQRFSFPTAPRATPSHEVTHLSARRLGAVLTERDSPRRESRCTTCS
ncbi:hypothetical protein Plhal710r2_c012g0056821 [Plasmopara halstedii]